MNNKSKYILKKNINTFLLLLIMSSNKKELESELLTMNLIINNLSVQLENAERRKKELSIELLKIEVRSDVERELQVRNNGLEQDKVTVSCMN